MKLLGHSISDLVNMIRQAEGRVNCTGLSGAEQGYLLCRLYSALNRPLFVVCAEAKAAELLAADTRFFSGKRDIPVITFPSYDILPFQPVAYHPQTACKRIETLYRMVTDSQPPIVITTISALLQRVIPREVLSQYAEYVLEGEEMDRESLVRKLIQGGYQETILVEDPGDFAVRGGLVDIFPPLYSDPIRIEFFGDTVESIRAFSAADQRSMKPVSEVTLLPAAETVLDPLDIDQVVERVRKLGDALVMPGLRIEEIVDKIENFNQFPGIGGLISLIHPSLDTLFDYMPKETLPIVIDPGSMERKAFDIEETVTKNYLAARNDNRLSAEPEALYTAWSDVDARFSQGPHLVFKIIPVTESGAMTCNLTVEGNDLVIQQLKQR
ncbi:MAG: hypothetical protein JRJ17_06610, partial [Deltaproteobacteria bacterium]|nr:hypothetical protein [Deltaproteobacteria bacterium]